MNKERALKIIVMLVSILFLSGCGSLGGQYSGFLGDYSQLRSSAKVKGALVYRSPYKTTADFDNFIIDPIRVHFIPSSGATAIDPEKLNELTVYFRAQIIKELKAGGYNVVNSPQGKTLRMRIAITDLKKTIAALNIHPTTKLSGAGLGGASIEGEGVDSQTDERIFAFVHTKKGSRFSFSEGLSTWGHAQQVMDFWAGKIVERLDEIRQSKKWQNG